MNILFLTHRLPYAPNRGDRIRAFHLLRMLGRHHEVHLASLVHDDDEAQQASRMTDMAASVQVARVARYRSLSRVPLKLASSMPVTHVMLDSPGLPEILARHVSVRRPDLVLAYCSGMARFALEPPLADIPFILDMVDVDSKKWATLGEKTGGPRGWVYRREGVLLARFEARASRRSRATTVVNAKEADSLLDLAPDANVRVLPNGIDISSFAPPEGPVNTQTVVFAGVMNYRPNEEGAIWMAEQVWPLIRQRVPAARLVLVGAEPTSTVRRLAQSDRTVAVTGTVPDVRPYLWNAAVAAVPLKTARGIQNKALEALAAGLPVVLTPVVRAGLPDEVAPGCIVAEDRDAFASALLDLLARTPQERRALAQSANLSGLEWPAQLHPLLELIDQAAAKP